MTQQMHSVTMTDVEYHNDTSRISKSGLDLIAKSPLHYWEKYLNPDREEEKPTPAKLFGKALHCAILEPYKFPTQYAVLPEDTERRSKAGKAKYQEFLEANGNKILLSADDYDSCMRISESIYKHPAASVLLEVGLTEQTHLFTEPFTDAPCKIRPDFYSSETGFIVDIKTTENASRDSFGRSCYNYRYHVQAAFYLDGMIYSLAGKPEGFAFIAVEKTPPYAVAVYNVTSQIFELGRETYLKDLETYVRCLKQGVWHGYDDYLTDLELPVFAFRKST